MLVKAIRTGFYKRIREPGTKFQYHGKECPSWCVSMDKKAEPKLSKDMSATDAIRLIGTMDTSEEINAFVDGDDRVTVNEALMERIENIEG